MYGLVPRIFLPSVFRENEVQKIEKKVKNLMNLFVTPQIKRAAITIAEFAVQQLALVVAQYLIELKRREATTKLTDGESNVQLLRKSVPH